MILDLKSLGCVLSKNVYFLYTFYSMNFARKLLSQNAFDFSALTLSLILEAVSSQQLKLASLSVDLSAQMYSQTQGSELGVLG